MGIFGVARNAAAVAVKVVTDADDTLTVYRSTKASNPVDGTIETTEKSVRVERAAFPDNSMAAYTQRELLRADERLVIVAQKPLRDLGWTVRQGDEILHRGIRSEVLQVVEDPAGATYTLKVKP